MTFSLAYTVKGAWCLLLTLNWERNHRTKPLLCFSSRTGQLNDGDKE